jgi:hypothetical protein
MTVNLVSPIELYCQWTDAFKTSRELAKRLLFSKAAPLQEIDIRCSSASISYLYNDTKSFNPRNYEEKLFIFSYIYEELRTIYSLDIGSPSFDPAVWRDRFHKLYLNYIDQLWFSLAVLGHKGPHLPGASEQVHDPSFYLGVAKALLRSVDVLLQLRQEGRIFDNIMGYWEQPQGWLHLWGLNIRTFASMGGKHPDDWGKMTWAEMKQIPDHREAYVIMNEWLNGS